MEINYEVNAYKIICDFVWYEGKVEWEKKEKGGKKVPTLFGMREMWDGKSEWMWSPNSTKTIPPKEK